MSRYRKVDPRIWNDQKFRDLDDKGRLIFFFLLTHPHMTALGAMRATIQGLAAEIGWPEKAFREPFRKICAKGMVKHDERASFLWFPKFLKYNSPENPNVVKGWGKSLDLLPECELLEAVLSSTVKALEEFPESFMEALPKAFREPFRKGMPIQEQEQEQEQDKRLMNIDMFIVEKDLDEAPEVVVKTKKNPCPHQKIIDLYHATLPANPTIRTWTSTRAKHLQARWAEDAHRQTLAWWRGFFEHVGRSKFLTGKIATGNRQPFLPGLDWMCRPENFAKICEGRYDND